jgi:hypothetical protein
MKIYIMGHAKNISRAEIKYLFNFYGNILLGKRLAKNISIELGIFNRGDHRGADVIPIDSDIRNRNHREFSITMTKDMSYNTCVRAIAHEMAHIRQFARGEFTCVDGNIMWWKGMKYELTDKTYPHTPWEKDADRSERWLLYFYKKHKDGPDCEWA